MARLTDLLARPLAGAIPLTLPPQALSTQIGGLLPFFRFDPRSLTRGCENFGSDTVTVPNPL